MRTVDPVAEELEHDEGTDELRAPWPLPDRGLQRRHPAREHDRDDERHQCGHGRENAGQQHMGDVGAQSRATNRLIQGSFIEPGKLVST